MTDKEDDFEYQLKMDAVTLQGPWLSAVAGTAIPVGYSRVAGRMLYEALMEEQERRKKDPKKKRDPYPKVRENLLKEIEKRIVQIEQDDSFVAIFG